MFSSLGQSSGYSLWRVYNFIKTKHLCFGTYNDEFLYLEIYHANRYCHIWLDPKYPLKAIQRRQILIDVTTRYVNLHRIKRAVNLLSDVPYDASDHFKRRPVLRIVWPASLHQLCQLFRAVPGPNHRAERRNLSSGHTCNYLCTTKRKACKKDDVSETFLGACCVLLRVIHPYNFHDY
jgi:hypothetical protein